MSLCLYLCLRVLRVVATNSKVQEECMTSWFDGTLNSMLRIETYGLRGAKVVYENAKLRMKIKLSNWFLRDFEFF